MGLTWNDHLSIGNATIDSDHKNLIIVVNRVKEAIMARDRDALSKSFELLDTYIAIHFRNEEKIAEAINYPFAQNKLEQKQLIYEMKYMIRGLELNMGHWPDSLVDRYSRFLSGWMADHIIKTDMKMKPYLQAHPYDFSPI